MAKIFVVDDSVSVCVAIQRMLGGRGHDVVWEKLGATALATLERYSPDLIISDLVLPDLDGYELCRAVKANPLLGPTPVIMISGIVDEDVQRQAREAGGDGLLKKPFSAEQLIEEVESLLGGPVTGELPVAELARAAVSRRLAQLLEPFDDRAALEIVAVLEPGGGVLARADPADAPAKERPLSALGQAIDRLLPLARTIAEQLDCGDFGDLVLGAQRGTLLVQPLVGGHTLVVALSEPSALGKTRYFARRLARQLDDVLHEI